MRINGIIKHINSGLETIIEIMKNILVFAIISGLLFNDPFGVIAIISKLATGIGENGIAGFISIAILFLFYNKK
mgnify:CR=1 FL=1